MADRVKITVSTTVAVKPVKAWEYFTGVKHITGWNFADMSWHCPKAESDLRPGGRFSYRMEARDGSSGFDFWGVFDTVKPGELLEYTMGDGRRASVMFKQAGSGTELVETFEAEVQNSLELQKTGWQAILDNFKKYSESCRG